MKTKAFTHCPNCHNAIDQQPGRGKARKYCSEACMSEWIKKLPPKVYKKCIVDGCNKEASRLDKYCETHYYRIRRNGTIELKKKSAISQHSGGYLIERNQDHPLAKRGNVYQHRRVFFDKHGQGPFACHWCGTAVDYDMMHVDHLDANKQNNNESNLVASCPACNLKRGIPKMRQTVKEKHSYKIGDAKKTMVEWADVAGISRSTLLSRIRMGKSLEQAVLMTRGTSGPKPKTPKRFAMFSNLILTDQ